LKELDQHTPHKRTQKVRRKKSLITHLTYLVANQYTTLAYLSLKRAHSHPGGFHRHSRSWHLHFLSCILDLHCNLLTSCLVCFFSSSTSCCCCCCWMNSSYPPLTLHSCRYSYPICSMKMKKNCTRGLSCHACLSCCPCYGSTNQNWRMMTTLLTFRSCSCLASKICSTNSLYQLDSELERMLGRMSVNPGEYHCSLWDLWWE